MKSIQLQCAFAILFLIACKPATTTVQVEIPATTQPDSMAVNPDTSTLSGHDYAFLTNKLFHYKASSTVGKLSTEQPYAGQWIDLDPDGTFKAGKLKDQTYTGRWGYNNDMKILELRPDGTELARTEWNVMHNDDMMVWVGTQTYNNNATQIQLVRSDNFPQ